MEIIQECAQNFKELSDTTAYTFHTSLGKKISVFDVDFKPGDFHHAAGLQYLTDISIPRNVNKAIPWILDKKKPITDDYLAKSKEYKGKANQERDVELRISELRFWEEYLFPENVLKDDKASGESEIISSNGLEGEKFRELFEDDLSVSNNKEFDNNTNSKENFIPNLYLYGGNYKVEDSDNIISIDSVNRNAKESEFAGVLSDSYGNRYDLTYLGRESLWEPYQVNVDVFAIADNPQFGLLCGGMGEEYPFVWLIDPEDYIWECSYILSE